MYKPIFILFLLLSFSFKISEKPDYLLHPVHVSYTNVEYMQDKKEFHILFKIFVDDFDKILLQKYHVNLELTAGKKKSGYEKYMSKYLLEHFKIIIDNKDFTKSRLKFSHSEIREKAIWLYYNYKYSGKSANFEIWNSIMTDLYRDQTNLLIFTFYDYQQAINFTNSYVKEKLVIKK